MAPYKKPETKLCFTAECTNQLFFIHKEGIGSLKKIYFISANYVGLIVLPMYSEDTTFAISLYFSILSSYLLHYRIRCIYI